MTRPNEMCFTVSGMCNKVRHIFLPMENSRMEKGSVDSFEKNF